MAGNGGGGPFRADMGQLALAFGSLRRMMMRNFSFLGLSTSALLLLALGGCNPAPVRLVDAHVGNDAATLVDTGGGTGNDANVDAASMTPDTGHSGACTYGGGCDLLDPTACPMMGTTRQACYPQMGAPACAPAGSAIAGASCTNLNDCDAGFVCLSTNTCSQLCCAASDCTNPGETCSPLGDGMGMALPNGVGFCYRPPTCTPVPNSGCPMTTQQCVVISSDGSTDCQATGTGAEGATCGGTSGVSCVAGTGCYGPASGPDVCSRLCRIAMGNADCTGTATTCSNVGLGTTYGLCM